MKVCLLNDSFPPVIDGVANVVMNYAKIMQEEKLAEVMVGTPKYPGTDYQGYSYQVIPYKSFDTTKIVKGYRAGNLFDTDEIAQMAAFSPDIIHSHCPVVSTVLARVLRQKVNVPIVFTYHTKFDIDIAKAVKARFIQKKTIQALVSNINACDEVWVVSKGAGENLKSLGFTGDYRVVHNGVDFNKGVVETSKIYSATKEYDLPDKVPIFLFVGRMIDYKGLPFIIEALKRLSDLGYQFRMVFIGSGPDETNIKKKAEQYGLLHTGKCIFTGPVYDRETLRAWYSKADLFLFPSTYDTNGIVVREAAACALPSVLIKGSCAAEGITNGRNGFLIKETPQDMSILLERICRDLTIAHDVGKHAMDEIYISWKESVYCARQRYGEIIDLKKSGKLPDKRMQLSDRFIKVSTELVEGTDAVFQIPKQMYWDVRTNMEGRIFDMQYNLHQSMEDMIEMMETIRLDLKDDDEKRE